jgi:hypothetical protein
VAGTAALIVLLRRRLGSVEGATIGAAAVRIVAASLLLGGVAYGVWYGLDAALGHAFGAQLLSVGAALATGAGVYLASARLLGIRELEPLLALRSRFRRG